MVLGVPDAHAQIRHIPSLTEVCREPDCGVRRDLRLCRAETQRLHLRWQWLAVGLVAGGLAALWLERRYL